MHTIVLFSEKAGLNRPLIASLRALFPESRIKVIHSRNRQTLFDSTSQGANGPSRTISTCDSQDNLE